jgi:hypothetical protein
VIPIREGVIDPEHIRAELGVLVANTRPVCSSPEQMTLHKSVGVAVQDAADALVIRVARPWARRCRCSRTRGPPAGCSVDPVPIRGSSAIPPG